MVRNARRPGSTRTAGRGLDGSESPEFLRPSTAALAAALPNVTVAVLDGQQHTAMDTAPQLFADVVVEFFSQP
jgi:hypothetical protein